MLPFSHPFLTVNHNEQTPILTETAILDISLFFYADVDVSYRRRSFTASAWSLLSKFKDDKTLLNQC